MSDASVAAPGRSAAPSIAGGRPRQFVVVAGLIVAAALLPFGFSSGGDVLNNLVLAAAYVVMALGLNVIVGFAGLLDLGYVAFFAIGAYTAAYLASGFWENAGGGGGVAILVGGPAAELPGIHLNFLLVLFAAAAAATFAGALIGIPTLRLRGDYIAIVTLAFGEIIGQVVVNGKAVGLFGGTLTSGAIGIGPIDRIDLPLLEPFGALDLRPWYWFALVLVAAVLVVNVHLRDSRIGRAWIALRDDEEAAVAVGIPVARTKLLAYGTGAALGRVSGAFLASYLSTVNASQFRFSFSIFVFSMVVLGGLGSIGGVVLAAILLSVLNNYLLPDVLFDLPARFGLDFDLSAISSGIYGLIVVLVMLLFPEGLVPARRAQAGEQRAQERPLVAAHAAGLVPDPVGGDEVGVDAEPLGGALVVGEAGEAEQRVGDVAGALGGQEVAVVRAAVAVHELHPGLREALEGVDLVRIDLVAQVAGDHSPAWGGSGWSVSSWKRSCWTSGLSGIRGLEQVEAGPVVLDWAGSGLAELAAGDRHAQLSGLGDLVGGVDR